MPRTRDRDRILFVSHTGLRGGGAEVVLEQTMKSATRLGYAVSVAAPGGALLEWLVPLSGQAFPLHFVPTRRTGDFRRLTAMLSGWLRTTSALRFIISQSEASIVYANSGVAALACVGACRLTRRRLIWHQHDIIPDRFVSRLVLRIAARLCARIVAVSEAVAVSLVRLGIPPGKIRVVHNGVRSEFFEHLPDKSESRQALGLPEDRTVVAMAGRLVPYKGHVLFLEAVAMLFSEGFDLMGVVAGSTPSYVTPDVDPFPGYALELRQRAERKDLAGRVVFIGQQADIRPLLAAADVLVIPSRDEPFPLVVLEGMAAGIPVIASDSGGHPEAVLSGKSGLLFETGSITSLVEALRSVLTDESLRSKLRAGGRKRALENFSPSRFERELGQVLGEVQASVRVHIAEDP